MPLLRKAQVHQILSLRPKDPPLRSIIKLLRLLILRRQRCKRRLRCPGYELRVSESLVVSAVAEELRRVLEEVLQVLGAYARAGGVGGPVAGTGAVEGEDEVVDGFAFRGDLAEDDAGAGEGGSGGLRVSRAVGGVDEGERTC